MYVHALLRSLKRVAIAVEQAHCRSLTVNLCGKPHPSISKKIYNYYRTRGRGTIVYGSTVYGGLQLLYENLQVLYDIEILAVDQSGCSICYTCDLIE